MPPVVVTLLVDGVSQVWLDAVRSAYFPPDRNVVPGHVSLFHALPADALDDIAADAQAACRAREPFDVAVRGVRSLGRGVAYDLVSPALVSLRADLRDRWSSWLTRQDAQPYRPHVTVTNKVGAERAAEVLAQLAGRPLPGPLRAEGLALWWYVGGPWRPAAQVRFRSG